MSRNEWIVVAVSVVLVGGLLLAGIINSLLRSPVSEEEREAGTQTAMNTEGLVVDDTVVGGGDEAVAGKIISVHYLGTLSDGTKFDSSYDRGAPFRFVLGAGQVIRGWELGVVGMKEGGKRKLTISPELGYGNQTVGPIPTNSTLVFEVELLDVADLPQQ